MNIDDVTKKLKEIGPCVRYDPISVSDEYRIHRWFVGSEPNGPKSMRACLAFPQQAKEQVIDFEAMDWPSIIEEGKKRYESPSASTNFGQ